MDCDFSAAHRAPRQVNFVMSWHNQVLQSAVVIYYHFSPAINHQINLLFISHLKKRKINIIPFVPQGSMAAFVYPAGQLLSLDDSTQLCLVVVDVQSQLGLQRPILFVFDPIAPSISVEILQFKKQIYIKWKIKIRNDEWVIKI